MRTLLDYRDCIVEHRYEPIEKGKYGDILKHKNTITSIRYFHEKVDNIGNLTITKVVLDRQFLEQIINLKNEFDNDIQTMEKVSELPF